MDRKHRIDFHATAEELLSSLNLPVLPDKLPGRKFLFETRYKPARSTITRTSAYGRVKGCTVQVNDTSNYILIVPGPLMLTKGLIKYFKAGSDLLEIHETGTASITRLSASCLQFTGKLRPDHLEYCRNVGLPLELNRILGRSFYFLYPANSTVICGKIASLICAFERDRQLVRLVPETCFFNDTQVFFFERDLYTAYWTAKSMAGAVTIGNGKMVIR